MPRYIDADKLIADGWRLERQAPSGKVLSVMSIADVPTADVEEVKHGEWIKAPCSEKDGDAYCSECNHWDWSDCKYCSSCGAKMDRERKR